MKISIEPPKTKQNGTQEEQKQLKPFKNHFKRGLGATSPHPPDKKQNKKNPITNWLETRENDLQLKKKRKNIIDW